MTGTAFSVVAPILCPPCWINYALPSSLLVGDKTLSIFYHPILVLVLIVFCLVSFCFGSLIWDGYDAVVYVLIYCCCCTLFIFDVLIWLRASLFNSILMTTVSSPGHSSIFFFWGGPEWWGIYVFKMNECACNSPIPYIHVYFSRLQTSLEESAEWSAMVLYQITLKN